MHVQYVGYAICIYFVTFFFYVLLNQMEEPFDINTKMYYRF